MSGRIAVMPASVTNWDALVNQSAARSLRGTDSMRRLGLKHGRRGWRAAGLVLFHEVRTRRSGSRISVELFLDFDPELPMRTVRERIEAIRRSVGESIPGADVTVIPTTQSPVPSS
ncbi:MAG: cation transporter dimerization domain-containing protein [Alphaproteobacteria bacterium]